MRPVLALNCLLQIEQERSEEENPVGNALDLAFRCARFCSASLILFALYSPAPILMRPRHFVRPCAIIMASCFTIYYAKQISYIIYQISYIGYKISSIGYMISDILI